MENFFNWMTKPLPNEDIIIWFNIHNMNYEKIELYGDVFKSLNQIILDTYLGDTIFVTKIILTDEDNLSHFEWCWKKTIDNFKKEDIHIKYDGEHKDYFKSFYMDTFYNQNEEKIKDSIPKFLMDIFDVGINYSKSDLDLLTELYKLIEKNTE
tara:strand:- start:8396 stop:8854 length:459 start_codon:yes stop_codon:yes gene_type:complete